MNNKTQPVAESSIDFTAINQWIKEEPGRLRDDLGEADLAWLLSQAGICCPPEAPPRGASPVGALSLSLCHSREFGPVIRAGAGGALGAAFDSACRPGQSALFVSVLLGDAAGFQATLEKSLVYGQAVAGLDCEQRSRFDQELRTLLERLFLLGRQYAADRDEAPARLESLTLDPLVFMDNLLVPLQAGCRFAPREAPLLARPVAKVDKLLHPRSIGVIGVSATKMNFGRIILKNLIASGYPKESLLVIRPDEETIDGVTCVPSLEKLDQKLDLLVVAVAADAVFELVDSVIADAAAEAVMLVPGGLGETEASREPAAAMAARMNAAHGREDGGPIFLGGNCLGVVSHPGGYDSWFIPQERLPKVRKKAQRNSALISQSGAFMITRLSQNPWLDPAYMVALGNQSDLTHSDMIRYFADHEDIHTIGIYVEGFRPLDGLAFARAVREATVRGKQVVVYKAGQTEAGAGATLGHTASVAGDYDVCSTLLTQAGALVARNFREFDDLFYIADALHGKEVGEGRLGAVSGAGFETVGMADSIATDSFALTMASLTPLTEARLGEILAAKRLDALMAVRNPFDINPGADDEAHLLCTQAMLQDPGVDAVVVGLDPASPAMRALVRSVRPGFDLQSPDSIVQTLPPLAAASDKPVIGIVDGGALYDPMVAALRDRGVCTFRNCAQGVAALARYTEARQRAVRIREAVE